MAFSRSCASRGKHQKRSESDRSFLRVESSREKNCTRRTSTIEHFFDACYACRGLIGVTTDPEFTLRVPIYSRRWHETVEENDRHDAPRHGTIARLSKRRNDSSTREKIRSTIDRSRIFLRSRDQLICETCASRRRLASTRDACTTLHRTYLRSYVRS